MRRQPGNADGISFVPLSVLGRALVGRALVLYIDDGPGDRINERGTADQATLAAWAREFRSVSGRCDFASVTVDVDCLLASIPPSPLSQMREQAMARECSLVVEECSLIVRESHRTSGAAQGAPSCRPSACAIGAVPMTCALQIRKWTGSGPQNHKFLRCGTGRVARLASRASSTGRGGETGQERALLHSRPRPADASWGMTWSDTRTLFLPVKTITAALP
jgi:hypothetical protein